MSASVVEPVTSHRTGHRAFSLHSAVHIGPKTQLGGVQDGLRMRLYLRVSELALAAGHG